VFHHEELFLVGAAGGLMSRMARALFREDVPSDYGASWTTLFLSPLLGAISAWFGIATIMWLSAAQVLGDAVFGAIDWNHGVDAVLIGTAFVLGFSERLFTSLLSAVEGKVTAAASGASTPSRPLMVPLVPVALPEVAAAPAAGDVSPDRPAQLVRELDIQPGERAAVVSDPASQARSRIVSLLGADNVFDVGADAIATKAPLDAVLIESTLTAAVATVAAAQIGQALRPDGRVVIVGRTPAALFEADAVTQRAQDHVGPSLAKDLLVGTAGLTAQEPPERLGGTDPVDWLAAFVKAAPGGSDR
jgi:hypothetical protein